MSALQTVAELLRDRHDPSEIRRITTRLVGLRALAARHSLPAWHELRSHDAIEAARIALQAEFPGLWPRALPDLGARLVPLLDAIDALPELSGDGLGQVFTELIGRLARSEGRRGGQYFTPPCLVALLTSLVPVRERRVYDPCCGSGGLLVAAHAAGASAVWGQELNPETWRLARWNALVHGLDLDVGPGPADTLRQDLHGDRRFGTILANPPFNLAHWGDKQLLHDPRFELGPPLRQANFAWLLHVLHHLKPDGHAAVILPNGTLTGRDARERHIRRSLLRQGRIEAIVALPDQLFHNTVIGACVWVLGPPCERVHLIDARALGESIDRSTRRLTGSDIARIHTSVRAARTGAELDEPGFARSLVGTDTDGDLRPGRWVGSTSEPRAVGPCDRLQALLRVRALIDEERRADEALLHALEAVQSELSEKRA